MFHVEHYINKYIDNYVFIFIIIYCLLGINFILLLKKYKLLLVFTFSCILNANVPRGTLVDIY